MWLVVRGDQPHRIGDRGRRRPHPAAGGDHQAFGGGDLPAGAAVAGQQHVGLLGAMIGLSANTI